MPAPRNPNTTKATDQRKANARQRKLDAAAALLREAGTITVSVHDGIYFHVTAPCGHSWPGMRHTDDVRIVLDRAMDHTCDQHR